MELKNRITDILKDNYAIEVTLIEQRPGGWSALAFLIEDRNNKYLLKVYNKKRPSVIQWIDAIERYTPLVKWFHDHTELKNNLVRPILTKSYRNKCEDKEYVYLLSEYIEGTTIGEKQLTPNQVKELAKVLAILHKNTSNIPNEIKEQQIKESFDINISENLSHFLYNELEAKDDIVLEIVKPYSDILFERIDRLKYLSNSLKSKSHQFVLSHSDAHNWNIMQGKNLYLIDWECLKLAPQEQDLILIITGPYAGLFLNEYKKHMNYEFPDFDAYEFYYLKRILDDIWEWIRDLRFEGLVKSEDLTLKLLKLNLEACKKTNNIHSKIKEVFI